MRQVAIIGAGPAGLAAAEVLSARGLDVTIYERMRTPGRKLLIAGRGGLNLTHSEPLPLFLDRYGDRRDWLAAAIEGFAPDDLRAWAESLGQPLFTGSSGRVFPRAMKASGLLRAWLGRLEAQGVVLLTGGRHRGRGGRRAAGARGCELGTAGLGWQLGAAAGIARRGRGAVQAGQLRPAGAVV